MAETAPAHARSEGVMNPAMQVFKVPPTDISINAYHMVTIQPTTTGINPMKSIIPALDDCVNLGRSYFTMELTLKKSDNGNLVANEKLWPVNNLAHSIIKQIDLQLNGTLISPQSDTYHYKAYLEDLLNLTERMVRRCWDFKVGTIKWISHPNGQRTIPTVPHLISIGMISLPITKLPWLSP